MPIPDFVLELRRHVGTAPLPLVGVTAVILRDGEVLLGRRTDNGALTPITGIVDPGEEPADAAVREALEEAGVRLRRPVVDTVALFRRGQGQSAVDDEAIVPLSDAARELGLPVHRPHHADGDALTPAQPFLALATRLDAREPQTVGSLARR